MYTCSFSATTCTWHWTDCSNETNLISHQNQTSLKLYQEYLLIHYNHLCISLKQISSITKTRPVWSAIRNTCWSITTISASVWNKSHQSLKPDQSEALSGIPVDPLQPPLHQSEPAAISKQIWSITKPGQSQSSSGTLADSLQLSITLNHLQYWNRSPWLLNQYSLKLHQVHLLIIFILRNHFCISLYTNITCKTCFTNTAWTPSVVPHLTLNNSISNTSSNKVKNVSSFLQLQGNLD